MSAHSYSHLDVTADVERLLRSSSESNPAGIILGIEDFILSPDLTMVLSRSSVLTLWRRSDDGYQRGRIQIPFGTANQNRRMEDAMSESNQEDFNVWVKALISGKYARIVRKRMIPSYKAIIVSITKTVERKLRHNGSRPWDRTYFPEVPESALSVDNLPFVMPAVIEQLADEVLNGWRED